ncbi:MFS transporter [Pseudomonas sp. GCM10022188]|uniref:MFS transporter n=1 Tax=Pseudomonas TaxID=286 RepID=UPI001E31E9AF|nr:MFS transporter [Pseudomonas oryzagri]MCC6076070.1 MFS transporter [Pseudomonas oryzagri]
MKLERFCRYENGLLVMLFTANGLMFFDRLAINFLMPFIQAEFSLSKLQIGALNAALGLSWAASGWLLGGYVDRREQKRTILVSAVVLFSAVSMLSGQATSFITLLLARVLMGVAEGPVLPVSQALMIAASTPSRRGFNMGFIQAVSTGVFGSVLGPAILIPLASALGWRTAFLLAGIPGLVLAVVLWRYVREPSLDTLAKLFPKNISERNSDKPLRNQNLILSIIIACLFLTTFFSITIFAPLYLYQQRQFDSSTMALIMTVLGISAVVGGAVVPAISDYVGRRLTLASAILLTSAAPLIIAFANTSLPVLCLALFVSYLGIGCMPIFLATIPAESAPGAYANRAIALVVGIGEVVGGCLSPLLTGLSADVLGPTAPFAIGFATAVIAAAVALLLRETAPRCIARSIKRSACTTATEIHS